MLHNTFRIILVLVSFAVLAACASTPKPVALELDPSTTRSLTTGDIAGFVDPETGVHVWRGIPFAAPPVGDLRWRAPRPAESWEGVRPALDHAPWCPQIRGNLDDGSSAESVPVGEMMGQEDCLYLNVYAPAKTDDAPRPVMMWIHGGSNNWGRAEQYNPAQLVANENVIVVVVQYRLGPLGWFAHPALQAAAETPDDRSANFGNLDHVAALKWISQNAHAFGGDPQNVTVFGESAGGHNVVALLASPLAKGLFHKAIIQSGSFDSVPLEYAQATHRLAFIPIAKKLTGEEPEETTADSLRKVDVRDLFAAYKLPDGETDLDLPRIIQDGVMLPDTPLRGAFSSADTFNAVPIITGTNKDETKLWNIFDDELVKWRFGIIPVARDRAFYNTVSSYPSRLWRAVAVDEPASMMVAGGHNDVWTYRFDWDEGRKYWGADFGLLFGAAHSLEIPFVMGDFDFLNGAGDYLFTKRNRAERIDLSKRMMHKWANFARSGDPGEGWKRWSDKDDNILLLDSAAGGGVRMISDQETARRIVSDLESDQSITSLERCRVYYAMRWWSEDPDAVKPDTCAFPVGQP